MLGPLPDGQLGADIDEVVVVGLAARGVDLVDARLTELVGVRPDGGGGPEDGRVLIVHKALDVVGQFGDRGEVGLGGGVGDHGELGRAHDHRGVEFGGIEEVGVAVLVGEDLGHARSTHDELRPVDLQDRVVRTGETHGQARGGGGVEVQRGVPVGGLGIDMEVGQVLGALPDGELRADIDKVVVVGLTARGVDVVDARGAELVGARPDGGGGPQDGRVLVVDKTLEVVGQLGDRGEIGLGGGMGDHGEFGRVHRHGGVELGGVEEVGVAVLVGEDHGGARPAEVEFGPVDLEDVGVGALEAHGKSR